MENSNKNIAPFFVGFLLIVLVVVITFTKPYLAKKGEKKESVVNLSQNDKKVASFSAEALFQELQKNQSLVLVDIRSNEEFKIEHILDAKNVVLIDLEGFLSGSDPQKKYILIDQAGVESQNFVKNWKNKSGDNNKVSYLEGGLLSWKEKYYPLVALGDPYSIADQSKVSYMKSEELDKLMTSGEKFTLIDLRKEAAFQEEHLKGARNIFLDDLESKRNEIPKGKKIVLYDKDGLWAFQGAVRLFDMGIFNVYVLPDGLDGWKQKGLETEKSAGS